MDPTIRAELRTILAKLYATEADIRRICDDAGIDLTRIAFTSGAANVWHAILGEAHKTNQVVALLNQAEAEYTTNPELHKVIAAYRHSMREPEIHEETDKSASTGKDEARYNPSDTNKSPANSPQPTRSAGFLIRAGVILAVCILVIVGAVRLIQYLRSPAATAVTPTDNQTNLVASSINLKVERSAYGENEYVITGAGIEAVKLGDLLVVYAKDTGGFEQDMAIVYVVDKNIDNLIGKVVFQNPDITLDSLASLRADNNLADVNLTRMLAIDTAFVGFVVGNNQIRLSSDELIQPGTELLVMELTANGDAIATSPPRIIQIDKVSLNRQIANASIAGVASWPLPGTLLTLYNIGGAKIIRPAIGENEYFIMGEGIAEFELRQFVVVRAQDAAGYEFDVAILYVVDKNETTLIATTIFYNIDVHLDSLSGLHVYNDIENVDFRQMIPVNPVFVGFTLENGLLRLNPDEQIKPETELEAVQLVGNGDAIPISPTIAIRVDTVASEGDLAIASLIDTYQWPQMGTLLVLREFRNTFTVLVNDFVSTNEYCIHTGDHVRITASGMINLGSDLGSSSPEGKDGSLLSPLGVLMFRIGETKWMTYDVTKEFRADKAGCLEFDINDSTKSDNSGAYSVQVEVNP